MRQVILTLPLEVASFLELQAAKDDQPLEVGVEMLLIEWVHLLKARTEPRKAISRRVVKQEAKERYRAQTAQ